MFLSFNIVTLVLAVVGPDFFAESMLEVVFPLSFVAGTILMHVNSVAIGLVIEPFSLKNITINVPELAVTAGLIETPVSFILCAIFPNLLSVAVLHIS